MRIYFFLIWRNLNPVHPRVLRFHAFVIISPLKRMGPFIWTNLNPLHPRMLCAKFGWNWLSGSGEDENVESIRRQRRRTTDKFWSEKLTWAFGSGEQKRPLFVYISSLKMALIFCKKSLESLQSESMVNHTHINSAHSIVTRHRAISPVAKVHHVWGRGFMIQRVILTFIKCLSADQNQLFYMKV